MADKVPSLSMAFMAVSLVVGVGLPVALFIYYRRVKKADVLPFFIGCAVMVLFAFVLEALVKKLILDSEAGAAIQGNIWLYGLFGGAMAGIFEETGRFLAFKTVLRGQRGNDANALMYGAGHGGIEAIAVLGITSVNNLLYSVMINSGNLSLLTASLPEEVLGQVDTAVRALVETPSWHFLMGSAERIFAVVIQISLSVLVWFAAKKKDRILLYPAAILLHLIVDAATVILSGLGMPLLTVEGAIAVIAVITALIARAVWRRNAVPAQQTGQTQNEETAGAP